MQLKTRTIQTLDRDDNEDQREHRKSNFQLGGPMIYNKCSFRRDKSIGTKIGLLRPIVEERLMIKMTFWMKMEYILHIFGYNFYIRRPREMNGILKFMCYADRKWASKSEPSRLLIKGILRTKESPENQIFSYGVI